MSSIALTESLPFGGVLLRGSGYVRRPGSEPGGRPLGEGGSLGSMLGRGRKISDGKGKPKGPVFGRVPDVGTVSGPSPGNVGAVVPFGGRRITSSVGNSGTISSDCCRAICSVSARVS